MNMLTICIFIVYVQSTSIISTLSGPYKNVEIYECQHNCRQRYADDFSLLYKCACLTYKFMEDVCSCSNLIVCVSVINS